MVEVKAEPKRDVRESWIVLSLLLASLVSLGVLSWLAWHAAPAPRSDEVWRFNIMFWLAGMATIALYAVLAIPRLWRESGAGSLFAVVLPAPTAWLSKMRWTGVGLFALPTILRDVRTLGWQAGDLAATGQWSKLAIMAICFAPFIALFVTTTLKKKPASGAV